MYTWFMRFGSIFKALMINHIHFPVFIDKSGIMSRCHIGINKAREGIISHHLQSVRTVIDYHPQILSLGILIRSIYISGTEEADLIASFCLQGSIRHKQIIIIGLFIVKNVRTFNRIMTASNQMFAVISIHFRIPVCLRMNGISGFFIDFQKENPTGPGAIGHPHFSVFIIENGGINTVWPQQIIIISCRKIIRHLRIRYNIQEITFLYRLTGKTGIQKNILKFIRSFRIICRCKSQTGFFISGCRTEIHHIFLHFFIVDHIRCPDRIPSVFILSYKRKSRHGFIKKIGKQFILCIYPRCKTIPFLQVFRFCSIHMRTENVIFPVHFQNRRVMDRSSCRKSFLV